MAPAATPLDTALAPLRRQLDRAWPGLALEWVAEVDSTNTELMRRARAGLAAPVLLVAGRQSAGRGRLGRDWQSGHGDQSASQVQGDSAQASLTFSLGLPLAPQDWSGLSLAVGVSVAESLDPDCRGGLRLKWPNDLWVQDRKLGGILIETAALAGEHAATYGAPGTPGTPGPRYAVIGIGLNIDAPPAAGMRTPPAALRQWQPEATPLGALQALAPALVEALQRFVATGFAPIAPRFAARDALAGREVELSDGSAGRCEGVGPGGELRVRTAQGLREVTSAEVSVRPRGMALPPSSGTAFRP